MRQGHSGSAEGVPPGWWRNHPQFRAGLAATGAFAILAAAGMVLYQHRLDAKRIGVVDADLALSSAAGAIDEAALAAPDPSPRQFSEDRHARIDDATPVPPPARAAATPAPAAIATATEPAAESASGIADSAAVAIAEAPAADATVPLAESEATVAPATFSGSGYNDFTAPAYGTGGPQIAGSAPVASAPSYPAAPAPGPLTFRPAGPPATPPTSKPTGPLTPRLPGPAPAIAQPPVPMALPVAGPGGPANPAGPIAMPTGAANPGPITAAPPAPATSPPPTVAAAAPGMLAGDPIMPTNPSATGPNLLPIPAGANGWTYFDPVVAIGYNYNLVAGDANDALTFGITDIRAVTRIGNGQYELYLFDVLDNQFVDTGQQIEAGAENDFNVVDFLKSFTATQDAEFGITDPTDGLTQFSLRGIDPGAGLDPDDPNAFVTGLLFAGQIDGNLFITPLTVDTATGADLPAATFEVALPEPHTLPVFALGLIGLALLRRRHVAKISPQSRIGITQI